MGGVSAVCRPSDKGLSRFQLSKPSLWWSFFLIIGRKRAAFFLSGLSRVHTRAVITDGSFRSGSAIR